MLHTTVRFDSSKQLKNRNNKISILFIIFTLGILFSFWIKMFIIIINYEYFLKCNIIQSDQNFMLLKKNEDDIESVSYIIT